MRLLLLLVGLLLSSVAAPAQIIPAAPAAVDTAAALHHLFAQRRHNGHVTLGAGAGLLAVSGIVVAVSANEGGSGALAPFLLGLLGTVGSVPLLVRGVVLTAAHAKGREERVLQAWQQHRLPKRWARRALVPEYMQPQK